MAFVTIALRTPRRARLPRSALIRALFESLATIVPVLFISAARCDVLPPGAAAMSNTRMSLPGARARTGRNDEADWIMYCPARYSGVAPIGTGLE